MILVLKILTIFFTTIGENLSKTVKSSNQGSFNCTTEIPSFKFKFDLVEFSQICRYLKMLSCKTTLDLTLSTSDIPADFKLARVTPVYKRKAPKVILIITGPYQ